MQPRPQQQTPQQPFQPAQHPQTPMHPSTTNHNYMINVIAESPKRQPQLSAKEYEELRQKKNSETVISSAEVLDGRLELLFNRVQFLSQQISIYDKENDQVKAQMEQEILRNKEVESVVNESIADVNTELVGLNGIVEQIAAKKAYLEKAVNHIKIAKLVTMESEFLKNENKNLKAKVQDLNNTVLRYQDNEKELLLKHSNLQKDLQDVIQQNDVIKNTYAANQVKQIEVEQQLAFIQAQHKKLLKDYETLESENKKLRRTK